MRLFMLFMLGCCSSLVYAEHVFKVCYHNETANPVEYDNSVVNSFNKRWKSRGELTGSGVLSAKGEPDSTKCFEKIADEKIFMSHYMSFKVNNTYVGFVNPWFGHPYVVAQGAKTTSGGKLIDDTADGKDNYQLHIFVTFNGLVFSNSADINNTSQIINPRKFKKFEKVVNKNNINNSANTTTSDQKDISTAVNA